MIEFIAGKLYLKQPHRAVIDVGGVGIEVLVPFSTSSRLGSPGSEVKLLCHLNWRQEDGPQLFGFIEQDERSLFRILTKVNKVGPKVALNIMSASTPQALADMIISEDISKLTSLKGIGPKLASRLILEVKEAVSKLGLSALTEAEAKSADMRIPFENDVVEALENLGYTGKEIAKSLAKLDGKLKPGITIEETIEAVLRSI